ncbi:MAG TPA: adenylate/guanylate cyclase domain-containing protein [Acidimicrobiales bacterium]|nr:adenylate/guanylate cyclase domain-containing protein [Acidimicrobiales bacterium]
MRVRRTFAFLDLSGFTAMTATEGDERSVALLGVFRGALRTACSRRGVRIAKWLGDGAMLVGVDPTPVVSAALEMQWSPLLAGEPIAVKCGITTGPVILLEGDDYIGHAVNVAARLCDLARAGEVLADPSLVPALPVWAVVADERVVELRGVDRPVPVVQLSRHDPGPAASADPICGLALTVDSAAATRTAGGAGMWLFCSDSCVDTWESRPSITGSALPGPEAFVRDGIA